MMNNTREDVDNYVCPSFNSYSANGLAEIAVRVAVEESNAASSSSAAAESGGKYSGDEDFEFALVREDEEEVSAEEFMHGGHFGNIFPVFNRDLLRSDGGEPSTSTSGGDNNEAESSIAVPLSKLFIKEDHERDIDPPSCSSSEADELENIPSGTYCVWRPKMSESPLHPNQCKKSKSTGSVSKRWKFRDLMRRSNSDGKDSFVFLTPKHRDERPSSQKTTKPSEKTVAKGRRSISDGAPGSPSPHEAFYVQNRAMKAEDKKKSYLPYRQDLVGLFANVNGLRRSFPHF